jgi:integrase/recombinase XerD
MAIAARPNQRGVDGNFEQLMLDFLGYLELERGLARNTLQSYRSDLLQFGKFLAGRGVDASKARTRDVSDFLTSLAAGNGGAAIATATIQRKAACLRSFYRHLRREGVRPEALGLPAPAIATDWWAAST